MRYPTEHSIYTHILLYKLLLLPRSLRACYSLVSNLLELSFLIIMVLEPHTCLIYLIVGKKVPSMAAPEYYVINHSGSSLTMSMYSITIPGEQSKWIFQMHGPGCMGHIRSMRIITIQRYNESIYIALLLYTLVTRSQFYKSKYYALEYRLASRDGLHDYYASMVNSMQGKKGMVSRMMAIPIEGSLRSVISSCESIKSGWKVVPSWIAEANLTPVPVNVKVMGRTLLHGDWCMLVRQPCLFTGSIQPVRVHILEDTIPFSTSFRIPIHMCAPYGADYDGYEMTLYPVYDPRAV